MKFIKRVTAPDDKNLNYIKTTYGGYNKCILINSLNGQVIPNCVGYAWGRFIEEQGLKDCDLSRGDAKNWYPHSDKYKRGNTPKLGAVICWTNSKKGHVAIVEEIYSDKSILISESGYDAYYFKTEILKYPYKKGSNTLQGFIYPDVDFEGDNMFNKDDEVVALEDVKLYTTIEKKESKYTIKKGDLAYVRLKHSPDFIALADIVTGAYFPSAWTNEQNKFKLYEQDYKYLYEEQLKINEELQNKIDKAIEDLK